MFNHIHTEGGTAYSYYITGAATVSSQLEDIMAVDGTINTGGIPINMSIHLLMVILKLAVAITAGGTLWQMA